MAKKQAPKETFPTLKLRGRTTTTHPNWDGNRPILIGDKCKHTQFGDCTITKVTPNQVHVKTKNAHQHIVDVAEVWFEITQVPHLAEAKPWPALLGKKEEHATLHERFTGEREVDARPQDGGGTT